MTRTAIIVGCDGQDGRLLEALLLSEGTRVVGLSKDSLRDSAGGDIRGVSIEDPSAINVLFRDYPADEVYYLAAHHHSSEDKDIDQGDLFQASMAVHVTGLVNVLESLCHHRPDARVFYAASSHIFAPTIGAPLDENSRIAPRNLYGLTKAAGLLACRYFREARGLRVSAGILFNHESPLRETKFVSRKIARAAVEISLGLRKELALGTLSAVVDWGWAPDFVKAFRDIVRLTEADDFVVATGQAHTVGQLVECCFREAGLDWELHVRTDPTLLTKPPEAYIGNPAKLLKASSWRPETTFPEMARLLVAAELSNLGHRSAT